MGQLGRSYADLEFAARTVIRDLTQATQPPSTGELSTTIALMPILQWLR